MNNDEQRQHVFLFISLFRGKNVTRGLLFQKVKLKKRRKMLPLSIKRRN